MRYISLFHEIIKDLNVFLLLMHVLNEDTLIQWYICIEEL